MKYEFLSHKVLVGAIVVGSLVIGTTGMVYGISIDQELQERDVEVKVEQDPKPLADINSITSNDGELTDMDLPEEILSNLDNRDVEQGSDPARIANMQMPETENFDKIEIPKDEIYKGYCKPILKSGKPSKDMAVSMEQAAYMGTSYVEKETGKNLKGCQVEMYCNKWAGLIGGGNWRGIIEIDNTSRYVFKVEFSNGRISEYEAYTRSKKGEPWKRTNENGITEQVMNETLTPYHKINVDIKKGMTVNISEDEDYAIDMHQEGEDYKVSYEVKNDTLYVKQKVISNKSTSISDENWFDITVPTGTHIDEITINQSACNANLDNLSFDRMNIHSSGGNIDLASCSGNEVIINSKAGNIGYEDSKTKSGKISVQAGNIMLGGIESSALEVNCDAGNIFFEAGMKGAVKAHTNAGNIFVEDGNDTECQYDLSSTCGMIVRE